MTKKEGWENWGDHPIVVMITVVAALLSILAFLVGQFGDTHSQNTKEKIPEQPSPPQPKGVSNPELRKVVLETSVGVDYSNLKKLLESRALVEADKETHKLLLQVAGKYERETFDYIALTNFPCLDLRTIDQLWAKASFGRFGLSVQHEIWRSVNGVPDESQFASGIHYHTSFSNKVGWRDSSHETKQWSLYNWPDMLFHQPWQLYKDLSFHRADLSAPMGQLPAYAFFWGNENSSSQFNKHFLTLMIRVSQCELEEASDPLG